MPRDIEKVRAARRRWYERNKDHAIAKVRERQESIKQWLAVYKGGLKCQNCPENRICCLDFHHRDSTMKEVSLSYVASNGWSIQRILDEIAKCDVLCANCHRWHHYQERINKGVV